jgi:hypothetical protein
MHVIDGVITVGGPIVCVVIIGPSLMQLDTRGPMVPSKVHSEGPVSVHVKDPHSVLLILVPLFNVGLMVVPKILHTSSTHTIKPAKLQYLYTRYEG